jgi:8-oxo-dGTP diphosphatase
VEHNSQNAVALIVKKLLTTPLFLIFPVDRSAETMKWLHVTCAIIERDDNLVLAVQRSAGMSMALKWEFPGGKIEPGETHDGCLQRELVEELGISLAIRTVLPASTYDYPDFRITLYPFVGSVASGIPTLHEHAAFCWKKPEELYLLDWAAADLPVLCSYLTHEGTGSRQPGKSI